MKAKDLINMLQAVDPEAEVTVRFLNAKRAAMCAKVEVLRGECLNGMDIKGMYIDKIEDDDWLDIIIDQANYGESHLEEVHEEFENKYPELNGAALCR